MHGPDLFGSSPLQVYFDENRAKPDENQEIAKINEALKPSWSALSLFFQFIDYLRSFAVSPSCSSYYKVVDDVIIETVNRGKPSDGEAYEEFKVSPLQLNEKGREFFINRGYILPEKIIPQQIDRGKCFGAVNYFLRHHLESVDGDIAKTAQEFQDGVPIAASIEQELYGSLDYNEHPFVAQLLGDSDKPTNSLSSEEQHILDAVKDFFNSTSPQGKILPHRCMTHHVEKWLDANYPGETMSEKNREALKYVENLLHYDLGAGIQLYITEMFINMNGMDIDQVIVCNQGPDAILNALPKLEPGDYRLTFRCYDPYARDYGGHAVGFVVSNEGTTYFYDPNHLIGTLPSADRTERIGKVLKHYTGYSAKGNTLWRRVKNVFYDRANYPTSPENPGCSLFKVKLATNSG
jgi:hypothetical protein